MIIEILLVDFSLSRSLYHSRWKIKIKIHVLQRYAYNVDFFVVILFVVFLNILSLLSVCVRVCLCAHFFGSAFTIYLHFTNYRTPDSHWLLLIENKPLSFSVFCVHKLNVSVSISLPLSQYTLSSVFTNKCNSYWFFVALVVAVVIYVFTHYVFIQFGFVTIGNSSIII